MHSRAIDRRSASKCQGKWPDQTLDQAFGLPEVLVAVSTSRLSCKRVGETRTLMPVWDSSGESRVTVVPLLTAVILNRICGNHCGRCSYCLSRSSVHSLQPAMLWRNPPYLQQRFRTILRALGSLDHPRV